MAIIGEIATFAFGRRDENDEAVQELRAAGWIACEGQSIAQTGPNGLPKLFKRIKLTWGSQDPRNVFHLPDLRGRFLRGWDNGAGVDKGLTERVFRAGSDAGEAQVGSEQQDSFKNHGHGKPWSIPVGTISPTPDWCVAGSDARDNRGNSANREGGAETRPINVNVMYCIFAGEPIPRGVKFFA